jgi:amphi-Trp domain-containing protein
VTEFKHEERLSREQAAERLADIAFALTVGRTLDLRIDGERVNLPVADDVRLKRESKANGGRIQVEVVLSWSA